MTDSPGTSRRRANTRARLLDAGAEVFAEFGLGDASVERICDRAGFTRGAFYSNFTDKDEMFLALAERVATEQLAAVRERVESIAQALSDPSALLNVLDAVATDRAATLLMSEMNIHAMRDADFAAALQQQNAQLMAEVVQIIDAAATAGGMRLRLPSAEAAGMVMAVWTDVCVRTTIADLPPAEASAQRAAEVGRVVALLADG